MNTFAMVPGLGPLVDAVAMYDAMSETERELYLGALAILGFGIGYSFVHHPEILPETVKGVGEIVKGIGEVVPL